LVPLERNYSFLIKFDFHNLGKFLPLFILLIFLLMCSAFFSASETAYSSVNIIRLKNYADEKKRGAKKAVYIAEKFDLTLTTLLVGNNLVNISATTIAAYIFSQTILNPTIANIMTTVVMTIIILTFGEIIPKNYSKDNAEKLALRFSGILFFVIKLLYPLTWIFIKLKKIFIKGADFVPYVTENELESIIDVMENEGVIEKDNAELLQSAINLSGRTVYEIMTPRVDIVAVEVNDDIESIKQTYFDNKYSRIPVYEVDKDNIIGILYERDFLTAYINNSDHKKINIRSLMSKPYYVSETTRVDDLIREMQRMKKHFAIVSDEYGGTSGIVTMEDALEELVGEIYDESDEYDETDDPEKFIELEENKYLISAEMEVEYLFDKLKLGKEPDTRYSSVGGFVYELCSELPYEGMQQVYHTVYEEEDIENPVHIEYDVIFTIDKVTNRRIKSIIVEVKKVEPEKE